MSVLKNSAVLILLLSSIANGKTRLNTSTYSYPATPASYIVYEGETVIGIETIPDPSPTAGTVLVELIIENFNGDKRISKQRLTTQQANDYREQIYPVRTAPQSLQQGIESPRSNIQSDEYREARLLELIKKDMITARKSSVVDFYFNISRGLGIRYNIDRRELVQNYNTTSGLKQFDSKRKMALDFDIIRKLNLNGLAAREVSLFPPVLSFYGPAMAKNESYVANKNFQSFVNEEFQNLRILMGFDNLSDFSTEEFISRYYVTVKEILSKIREGNQVSTEHMAFLDAVHKLSMYYALGMIEAGTVFNSGEVNMDEIKNEFRNQLAHYVETNFDGNSCSSVFTF